jgi:hypothetical protein
VIEDLLCPSGAELLLHLPRVVIVPRLPKGPRIVKGKHLEGADCGEESARSQFISPFLDIANNANVSQMFRTLIPACSEEKKILFVALQESPDVRLIALAAIVFGALLNVGFGFVSMLLFI